MKDRDEQPAFQTETAGDYLKGMTMRQYYKAAALTGLIMRDAVINDEDAARKAGVFADAMLAEDESHAKGAG